VSGEPAERPTEDLLPDIRIVSGNPDDHEMAALTAVLAAVLEEFAVERGRREPAGPSAGQRTQRTLRGPLHAGPGQWNGFGV
jgi:hypothetical protein